MLESTNHFTNLLEEFTAETDDLDGIETHQDYLWLLILFNDQLYIVQEVRHIVR